eukprot:443141_1
MLLMILFITVHIFMIIVVSSIPNPTGNNFTICHWDTIITDPARPTHQIPLKTHYPCNKTNTYPLMVFGHASTTSNTWYNYVFQTMVPQGYILTMPGSYEVFNDSHKLFAADMAYTLQYFYDQCNITQFCPLYGMIMNKSIVSGHSLGGAASLLIAGNAININEQFKHQFTSIMTLSGCGVDSNETNYTYAAQHIHIPSFLITGSSDCMCNPPYNISIVGYYNDIPHTVSTCKYIGIITNATHCHFQDEWLDVTDETCVLLEDSECRPLLPNREKIPKERQWEIVNTYFGLFMYQTLYVDNDKNAIQAIEMQLEKDKENNVMTFIETDCSISSVVNEL